MAWDLEGETPGAGRKDSKWRDGKPVAAAGAPDAQELRGTEALTEADRSVARHERSIARHERSIARHDRPIARHDRSIAGGGRADRHQRPIGEPAGVSHGISDILAPFLRFLRGRECPRSLDPSPRRFSLTFPIRLEKRSSSMFRWPWVVALKSTRSMTLCKGGFSLVMARMWVVTPSPIQSESLRMTRLDRLVGIGVRRSRFSEAACRVPLSARTKCRSGRAT